MAMNMKDSSFRVFEKYVLSGKKIEEALKELVEGSDSYNYLKAVHLLNYSATNLSSDQKKFLENYLESESNKNRTLILRNLLIKYDMAKKDDEKKNILSKISKEYLNLNFDYQRPADFGIKKDVIEMEKKRALKDEALLDKVDLEKELLSLYEGNQHPRNFAHSVLANVDFSKLTQRIFEQLVSEIEEDIIMISNKSFYTKLAVIQKEYYKTHDHFNISSTVFNNMTLEQLDLVQKSLPKIVDDSTYASIYFSKLFDKELSEETNLHLGEAEKRENLMKMYNYAKKLPSVHSGLQSSLLLELLENGLRLDSYSEELFLDYLRRPVRSNFLHSSSNNDGTWNRCLASVQVEHNRPSFRGNQRNKDLELLTKYLENFFRKGKTVSDFSKLIDKDLLVSIYEDTMLLAGKKVDFNDRNSSRLEQLATEVRITISDNNKKLFKIGEDISLFVNLKNVPTLFIKVFEINSENYYRKTLSPFRTDVNLDGLVSTIERSVEFKQSAQLQFREELCFPELKNKLGLYIIELIGNGKSSRAVIKVGTLSVITRPTVEGQLCYILDCERNVCSDESTGIFMENQFFKAKTEGRIMIPYLASGSPRTPKAILLHQGLAQLVDYERLTENYSLSCGFHLLPESVIMGKQATILLRPQLQVNGRACNLNLLKNIRCILSTSNYIDNIPSTKAFNDLKLNDNKELEIKFQVGANMQSLRIEFAADVMNKSKNITQTLQESHNFECSTHSRDVSIGELYLSLDANQGYYFHALGKNGEPIIQAPVQFEFTTPLFTRTLSMQAMTNDLGRVKLGWMKQVRTVSVTLTQSSGKVQTRKLWNLPTEILMQYPKNMDIIEGETLELPVSRKLEASPIFLKSVNSSQTLRDFSPAVSMKIPHKSLYGQVTVSKLESGRYVLKGVGEEEIIIRVHQGVRWSHHPDYILKQYSLLENKEQSGFIKIRNVDFEESKEGKTKIDIQIDSATKDKWRVHVMCFRYLPENLDALTYQVLAREQFMGAEYYFQKWNNFYLSNRELSTEFRYCFDRRYQERLIGNTLDRPKLLLNRTLVKTTTAEREIISQGELYADYNMECQQVIAPMMANYAQKAQKMIQKADYRMERQCCDMPIIQQSSTDIPVYCNADRISTYQNFLSCEPLTIFNLPASPDGKISIELEKSQLAAYSCVLILAVDKGSVAHSLQALPSVVDNTRDLSLKEPLDDSKFYSEMRTAQCIPKYGTHILSDITSTDVQIVDSLEKILLIHKELIRLHRITVSDIDKFEKLSSWNLKTEEEKNKIMSVISCHELHLFIYKKDPDYFDKVVRHYIWNKMEKSFVDYYLLNNMEEMLKFANKPDKFEQMNSLEKALLTERLIEVGNIELATQIVKSLKDSALSLQKKTASHNKVFDTVLSLNSLKTSKDDIASIIDESRDEERDVMRAPQLADCMELDNPVMMFSRKRHSEVQQEMIEEEEDECEYGGSIQKVAKAEYGETKEYAETHYWGNTNPRDVYSQIQKAVFWVEYAEHCLKNPKEKKPFISQNFTETFHSLTEIFGSLALLDLPFRSIEHGFRTTEGRSAELKAADNMVLFKKEVRQSNGELRKAILVAQRILDFERNNDEDFVIDEYLVNHIYTGQVIITNISSHPMEFDVLLQIPQGSMPISSSSYQKSFSEKLDSFRSTKLEYYFYFPKPGNFTHFGANVSIDSAVVAKAEPSVLKVVKTKSKISAENFREVLSTGNHSMILNFLKEKPIESIKGFSWYDMYWLLSDKKFYEPFVALLKQQKRFEQVVWSFSLYHQNDEQLISEYLNSLEHFKSSCGFFFNSKLLTVRPEDSEMRHLDYYPLINPRVHRPSTYGSGSSASQNLILNNSLYHTYKQFILYLIDKPALEVTDKINLTFYLLLQDRVKSAYDIFKLIDYEKEIKPTDKLKLQYDYMTAYFDFYYGQPKFAIARDVVAKYINYPVLSWRLMFLDMEQHLREFDGEDMDQDMMNEEEKKELSKTVAIHSEVQLAIMLEGKEIVVDYNSISELAIKFYEIDLEILFSRTPFLTQSTDDFSYVKPTSIEKVALDPKKKDARIPIPAKFANANAMIEVMGEGLQRFVTYFSNSLHIQIFENYGEIKVTDDKNKMLSQVYIKVFAMAHDGAVVFYKDGYTDIRGRFDYVSLNASNLSKIKKFSILIKSDESGSVIREALPPSTTIREEEELVPAKSRLAKYYQKTQLPSKSLK